jgi:hypothetical protein
MRSIFEVDTVITLLRRFWDLFLLGLLAILVLVGLVGLKLSRLAAYGSTHSGTSASTSATLNVLPTTRSVTVSPGYTTFGDCRGGDHRNRSTPAQLGYPNGECSIGTLGAKGTFPITVQNTGITAKIWVSASNAVPADNGKQWLLCGAGSQVACTGLAGKPGVSQYRAQTAAKDDVNSTELTTKFACDSVFDATGGCFASRRQSRAEGIKLIGPTRFADRSTSYTITITWMAVAP